MDRAGSPHQRPGPGASRRRRWTERAAPTSVPERSGQQQCDRYRVRGTEPAAPTSIRTPERGNRGTQSGKTPGAGSRVTDPTRTRSASPGDPHQDRKKIVLSESGVLSLWLRHLPSLEKAVLDLCQRLIALQSKSFREMEQIIKDSYLPQAAGHPGIFKVIDDIFRSAILESEGNIKIISILRLFTHCFIQEYYKNNAKTRLPIRAYFSHKNTPLVLALLRKVEGLASNICFQHLKTIVEMLRRMDSEERSHENVFESWFLLIRLGAWVDIATEQLLTSDPEISDDLLWLLAFYYNPCNESQSRGRTMVDSKAVYECLVSFQRSSTVCAMSFYKLFSEENNSNKWHPCTLQLVRHLCVTFILLSPEWHSIAKDCVSHMTQTQEAASEVSDVLARTLSRLDIPGMESQKTITIAHKLLQDL